MYNFLRHKLINAVCTLPSDVQLKNLEQKVKDAKIFLSKWVKLHEYMKTADFKGLPRLVRKWKEKYPATFIIPYDDNSFIGANDWERICKETTNRNLTLAQNNVSQAQSAYDQEKTTYQALMLDYEKCIAKQSITSTPTAATTTEYPTGAKQIPFLLIAAAGGLGYIAYKKLGKKKKRRK
jgi:hypothetical protein